MSVAAKDGAWVSASNVTRIECSRCGVIEVTRWPQNDRAISERIRKHLDEKHNGLHPHGRLY